MTPEEAPLRAVIAEDEVLLREGLQMVVTRCGFTLAAAVADATALVAAVEEHRPALVVTDIRMPPGHNDDGLRAAIAIRRAYPEINVVVLSAHVQRRYATELMSVRGGGVGYLLKQRVADLDRFCADLQEVARGGTVLDPEIVAIIMSRATMARPAMEALTQRQLEVLGLVAEGRSNAAIAQRLHVTERAVVQHVSNIYEALDLAEHADDHRRVLAVLRYLSDVQGVTGHGTGPIGVDLLDDPGTGTGTGTA